jgi:DNA-3-methyladenine glycosylase I
MSYCEFTKHLADDHLDKKYHNEIYGFPVRDDNELFGRLILEINQAGLNWSTILKKERNFRRAFNDFKIEEIALYGQKDKERLLNNKGVIRNKLKIDAVIHNAKEVIRIQSEFDSFNNWLYRHKGLSLEEWTELFRRHFKFVGTTIVEEFLMSIGFLKGAHEISCPIYNKVLKSKPLWLNY